MPAIPTQGGNNNTWGTDLNAYLAVPLNPATGALNTGVVHYSALNADANGYWSGLIVPAAPPTGVAATDTANTATVWNAGASGLAYQLQAGTYVVNPTTLTKTVWLYGAPNKATVIQLAGQGGGANAAVLTIGASGTIIDGITFDGNRATVGSGNYWSGVVTVSGGVNDIAIRRCKFQNSARTAIYANGTSTPLSRLTIDRCSFATIGTAGAGTGGACIMFDGGVNDSTVQGNRATAPLTSNFIKVQGATTVCTGNLIAFNTVDYTTNVTGNYDTTNSALAIELFNGAYYTRCIGNSIYGPTATPTGANVWGISCGDARFSTVAGNTVIGAASNIQAMQFGIETAECPFLTVTGNTIQNVVCGMNSTNNNPLPSHAQTVSGNVFWNCYTNGFTSDSGPSGIKLIGNSFVDCGQRYVFLNTTGAITKAALIEGNSFHIKDQTRLDGEGQIFGVYVLGTGRTDVTPVDISGNYFGPFPAGASTIGLTAIEVNNPQGVRILDNSIDGARPSDGAAQAARGIQGFCYGLTVRGNKFRNIVTEAGFTDTGQINTIEMNDWGSLGWTNWPPTAAAGANNGTAPPAPVIASGSAPRSGSLTFGSGSAVGLAAGAQVVVTFPAKMLYAPNVTLTAGNDATQVLGLSVSSVTNAGFTITTHTVPATSQTNTTYSVGWLALVA